MPGFLRLGGGSVIVLFTDFGTNGPYVGQMQAVLAEHAPGVAVINLLSDAPAFNPQASAYLLAALVGEFPAGTVFVCVVDPGVGTAEREPVALEADGRLFVGPGNGLFELVNRRARERKWWRITWRPGALSASFHGRDIFAPMAGRLVRGNRSGLVPFEGEPTGADWPDDLSEVIYLDSYGNAVTGLRGESVGPEAELVLGHHRVRRRRTFGEAPVGSGFWYVNSMGLVEVAVNQDSAADTFGLAIGAPVHVHEVGN
jgi:S-adenosylmethionine hydrolase